jgi:hypothetical protein
MKKLAAVLTALIIILTVMGLASTVGAADLTKKGSLTIITEYNGAFLSDMNVEIFHIADAYEDNNGTLKYEPTLAFKDALKNVALTHDMKAAENVALAGSLRDYISENSLTGTMTATSNIGQAVFSNLDAGMYLITQNKNGATGNNDKYNMQSFIVPVPYRVSEGLDYNFVVSAHPKIEPVPEPGTLTLTKIVTGQGANLNKTFAFTITFKGHNLDKIIANNGTFVKSNNGATWKGALKAGESITFWYIPIGTEYEIAEDNYAADGYASGLAVNSGGWSGKIISGETPVTVTVDNHYTPPFGRLTLSKTVTGSGANLNRAFGFNVTFSPASNGILINGRPFNNNQAVPLSHGESAVFTNIPFGTTYRITENDYTSSGYTSNIPAGGYTGIINLNNTAVTFNAVNSYREEPTTQPTTQPTTIPPPLTDPTTQPTTQPPVTTQPPSTTTPPITTEPPSTTNPPVTTQPPSTTAPPTTTEPSITEPSSTTDDEDIPDETPPLESWWDTHETEEEDDETTTAPPITAPKETDDEEEFDNTIPLISFPTDPDEPKDPPKTGDNLPMIVLFLFTLSGIIIAIIIKKKNDKKIPE